MANLIIAISRTYGSGGRSVAKRLSTKLGIPYYDVDIVNELVKKTGYTQDIVEKEGESMASTNWFVNLTSHNRFETNKQDAIWTATEEVIRDLADKESCIIVGRCADYILRKHEGLVNVFLYADYDSCAKNLKEIAGASTLPSPKELAKIDKTRAAYYEYYTDRKWADARNYTLSLDTGKLGFDKCAEIIASVCKQ